MGSLKKGDRIFGKWRNGPAWFPGVIINLDDLNNAYFVRYDDGDEELIEDLWLIQKDKAVKSDKLEEFEKRSRVIANWKKTGKWYPGKIEVIDPQDKKINIIYDDGDTEWIYDFSLIQKDKSYQE